MKRTITHFLVILTVVVFIFFIIRFSSTGIIKEIVGQNPNEKESTVLINDEKLYDKKVPFFDIPTLDDKRIKLSQYSDKPFVIVFFVSWNIESVNQLKIIDKYMNSKKTIDNLVDIIAINSQEDSSVMRSFMRRGGYEVIVGLDHKGEVSENFNIKSLPTTFFIDRDGIIREIYLGVVSEVMLVDKIEQLIN